MKRLIVVFIFLIFTSNVASGQALLIILFGDKLSTEKFQMGINASLSYSDLAGMDNTKCRWDWAFGAFGEIRFNDNWYLHFDLTVKTPAGADEVNSFEEPIPEIDDLFTDYKITREINYITLPVYIKYKMGNLKLGIGGIIGYMTSGKDVYSGTTIYEDDFTMTRDVINNLNRWDAGVTAMLDYYFKPDKNMRSLRLGLKYYYGLIDVLKDNPGETINNSIFLLSLGIPVGGSSED